MPEKSERILVLPFKHGPFWNFSYLVACTVTRQAVIIDPAWDVANVLAAARDHELDVTTVFLTHGHSDHSHGVSEVVAQLGASVIAHESEVPEIRRTYAGAVESASGRDTLRFGEARARVLYTPGHTTGSLSLLVAGQLFTGDALHVGALGRSGHAPDAMEQLWTTVNTVLRVLPAETIVRPGHDAGPTPSSTLAIERARLPALGASSFQEFVRSLHP